MILNTATMLCRNPSCGGSDPISVISHLFVTAALHRLKISLSKIQGIKHPRVVEIPNQNSDGGYQNVVEKTHPGVTEVRTMMEPGHETRGKREIHALRKKAFMYQISRVLPCIEEDPRHLEALRIEESHSPNYSYAFEGTLVARDCFSGRFSL